MTLQTLSALAKQAAPAIANHLWQSTLFVIAAALLTLALRKNQARIRYALWLAGSIKFLVPFSFLIALGTSLAPSRTVLPDISIYNAAEQVSQPFPQHSAAPASQVFIALPVILACVWLCGFIALLIRWFARWQHVAAIARTASPVTQGREPEILRTIEQVASMRKPVPLLLSHNSMEPGIFGIIHPVLLWPAGISSHLDDTHLEAVLAHELCHLRRGDNLSAAIHMLVEALFWFFPPVWWIGARLIHERERACDEEVLALGNQPETYAESILRACKFSIESPLSCVSGVTGSNLKQRIVHIMTQSLTANLTFGKKLLVASFAAITIAAPVAFGILAAPAVAIQPQSGAPLPAYQVVTLKPVSSDGQMTRMEVQPNEFIATGTTVRHLIEFAYNIKGPQLSGGPSWIDSDHFDIDIKIDGNSAPQQGNLKIFGGPQTQNILKAVLADRFNLKLLKETKVLPVYDLIVSSTGSKLTPAPVPQPTVEINGKREAIISEKSIIKNGNAQLMLTSSLQTFADHLSGMLGTPVIDKTGLKGDYDIALHWNESPDHSPDVIAAMIQDQLGLTLQQDQGPVTAFVIDNIETPSET